LLGMGVKKKEIDRIRSMNAKVNRKRVGLRVARPNWLHQLSNLINRQKRTNTD